MKRFLILIAMSLLTATFGAQAQAITAEKEILPSGFAAATFVGQNEAGNEASILVAAWTRSDGPGKLVVRICADPAACEDFSSTLGSEGLLLNQSGTIAQVNASIDGLGEVTATVMANEPANINGSCLSPSVRGGWVLLRHPAYLASIKAGGRVGEWHVYQGGCGTTGKEPAVISVILL